jgi:ketosteroid isomerase-like protein
MLLQQHNNMSNIVSPEELLNSQVEEFNKGNISFLMTLYEKDACFAYEPGKVVKDMESIRRTLQGFIDMGAKLEARARRVLYTSNIALLITEWSVNGTASDGKPVNLTGRGIVVLRRQSDGTWLMVIENPWGTD